MVPFPFSPLLDIFLLESHFTEIPVILGSCIKLVLFHFTVFQDDVASRGSCLLTCTLWMNSGLLLGGALLFLHP